MAMMDAVMRATGCVINAKAVFDVISHNRSLNLYRSLSCFVNQKVELAVGQFALPNNSKWLPDIGHQYLYEFKILSAHLNCLAKQCKAVMARAAGITA
jgi:hypothetical protein